MVETFRDTKNATGEKLVFFSNKEKKVRGLKKKSILHIDFWRENRNYQEVIFMSFFGG